MAGPPLSHILDPPRPTTTTGRDIYSTPDSYAQRSSSSSHHHHHHQQQQQGTAGGAPRPPEFLSPENTRNLSTPPVPLPPPTPTTSTLQVRPGPAPAGPTGASTRSGLALPAASALVAATSGPASGSHSRSRSRSYSDSQNQPQHQQGQAHLGAGAATAVPSPLAASTITSTTTSTPTSQSNHRGTNLYACRDCGRSYSRPEHLVRHVQTHTLGRRFVCEICQKSFARKDLLRRHVANHDNDSPKKRRRTTTSPGAGRVSHACRSCAVARVKCDDTKPCRRCVSRKLTCVSTEAPSTAAMHLMHFSANAHSSAASSPSNANNDPSEPSGNMPVTAHSPVPSSESHSPRSFGHQQPRPLPAPHSAQDPAPQQQHHHHHHHGMTSNTAAYPSPYAKLPSNEPRTSEYPPLPVELEPATSVMDPNRLPFSDFLRNILYENSTESTRVGPIQGLTVLDFCDHGNLDLTDDDFSLLDHWNIEGNHTFVQATRGPSSAYGRDSSADMAQVRQDLVNIWTNSSWSSDARSRDSRGAGAISGASDNMPETRDGFERVTPEKLDRSARDRVLAMVLSMSRPASNPARLASSFPSGDVMDMLVQNFLMSVAHQASEWIHFPTFRLNAQPPEWIAVAAAAGAASSPIPTLRKFGYILQDAARVALPTQFDDSTTTIRDVALVQALILIQEMGLWSGNRRRMKLAQSQVAIPVTLMRYRNKFQRSAYPAMAVEALDDGAELDEKWRRWVDRERWKRLVFHCFLRDAQCSMTTLTNQAVSYAELTLPLPEVKELWLARSATEWKAEYLQRHVGQDRTLPCVGDLFHDIHLLPGRTQRLDTQFSASVYLHGYWALILEYRKLSAVHLPQSYTSSMGGNQNLLLSSRHQELVKELQSFQLMVQEWPDMTAQEHMLLNLLIMNLHVSLDDLQLFAGKEGEEQARRIYPVLQQWATNSEARAAIWHAGQVLRYAKYFPPGHLKDFHAVLVHQAALVLWTYGVVAKANRRHPPLPSQYKTENVYLDGSETGSTPRFIGFGQGRPAIRGPMVRDDAMSEVGLEDTQACMGIAQEVLRSNFRGGAESLPPMVENLCTLMQQLGDAAWAANLGSS